MLLDRKQSCVVLVDVQEKLLPLIDEHESLIRHCAWVLRVAQRLNIPIIVSEQYPKGLGPTSSALKEIISTESVQEKLYFSCASDANCLKAIENLKRNQIVLMGIETHVCVLQTALELQAQHKQVFVVVDAVSSRKQLDKKYGLKRMSKAGVELITREMMVFEWLRQSGTPEFKQISQEFLKVS